MTELQAVIAYNRMGRVGSSSIFCATVASNMVATSQQSYPQVQPAVINHIDLARLTQ